MIEDSGVTGLAGLEWMGGFCLVVKAALGGAAITVLVGLFGVFGGMWKPREKQQPRSRSDQDIDTN